MNQSAQALVSAFFLVTVAYPALVWAGAAADLCADPWETACVSSLSTPQSTQADIAQLKAQIRGESLAQARLPQALGGCDGAPTPEMIGYYDGLGLSPELMLEEATLYAVHEINQQDKSICFAKIVETKVFKSLGATLTPSRIRAVFETVRTALIESIRDEFQGRPELQSIADQMVANVSKIQFLMSDRYREWAMLDSNPAVMHGYPNLAPLTSLDGGICGSDLLNRNAFSDSTGYIDKVAGHGIHTGWMAVVGCPGQWLDSLAVREGTVDQNLYHLFGHEMSHMIHATWNRVATGDTLLDGTPMRFVSVPAYTGMMSCLRKNYEPLMPPVSEGYRISMEPYLRKILDRAPTDVDFRSNEISADFWGTRVMSRLLDRTSLDPDARAHAVMNGLRRFCFKPNTTQLYTTFSDTHPSGRFRVETALRSPELRHLLNCPSRISAGTWGELPACSTRGEWR